MTARPIVAALAALVLLPAAARADVVVPDDQIVTGKQCVGALCADNEVFANPAFRVKVGDTPGINLVQTGDGGYTAQTWDVAGNEANFFVRDVTGGSRLTFRIRPGAPTGALDLQANGEVESIGVLQQRMDAITATGNADGAAILTALRTLPIRTYRVNHDGAASPHLLPAGPEFRAAFGLGGNDQRLAPGDVAAVALAAVKELDARVSALSLTPGPKGETGAQGEAGATGAQGERGAHGEPGTGAAPTATTSSSRIAALESANRKLAKELKSLRKQVAKLRAKR
jgi:hypothetical protein